MEIAQIKAFNKNVDSFIDKLLPELEEIYKDLHKNPELPMQGVCRIHVVTTCMQPGSWGLHGCFQNTGISGMGRYYVSFNPAKKLAVRHKV